MSVREITLEEARGLPRWRGPWALLVLMAVASPLAFATWSAAIANFAVERAGFDGADNGWMHSIREIPGFLAFLAIFIIAVIREQRFALISLLLLGGGVAVTAEFPSLAGILVVTFISSIGFHYYETVAQSLQLQWLPKDVAPKMLGWIAGAGAFGSLLAYGGIVLLWEALELDYRSVFVAGGGACAAIAIFAWIAYPQFRSPTPQRRGIVLKRRYWLYYALTFMAGARRQIFVVFAAFMMVERFGFAIHEVTSLFLATYVLTMIFSPLVGRMIHRFGERTTLTLEYAGLVTVFIAYGGVFWFDWSWRIAAGLYLVDHLLFSMAFAQKTYFQKIADPEDQAPTAAVAFTINHIAAVFLPALLGYLWLTDPSAVYGLAAAMAFISLMLARLVPRHPDKEQETIFARRLPLAQPAEQAS